ncbi:hypothetical protein [Halobacteriovorax sp. HLS]|uniref:hypothetical protein n=1 Tax=Halobacteriovorax sp. HLS TaxID=2234000 RepID=UPI000FDBED91|nr:hypothetical protein [Halobacteriovorax sp. HLS]
MSRSKILVYSTLGLVVIAIISASYFDKDNNLKDDAIRFLNVEDCQKISHEFIKNDCIEIINKKKSQIKN